MSARIPTFNTDVIRPFECVREGREMISDRYWFVFGFCLVGMLIAGMAPFYLLYGPMICGISYCLLAMQRNEPIEFADLFKGFNFFGPAFVAGLLQMLPVIIVAVPLYALWIFSNIVLGPQMDRSEGLAPFIVPALVFCYVLLIVVSAVTQLLCEFSFPLVVEWKMSGWDAVKTSAQAIRANLGGAVGLLMLTWLYYLGGALLCGFGIYLVIPISHAAWTVAYRRVFPEYPHHLDRPPDPPKWQEWKGPTGD